MFGDCGCGPGKWVSFSDSHTDKSCHRVHRGVNGDLNKDGRDNGYADRQFTATPCVVSTTAAMYEGPGNSHVIQTPTLSVSVPAFVPTGNTLTSVSAGQLGSGSGEAMEPVSTLAAAPLDALSVALLAQQLPSLPNFNRENLEGIGESFNDWLERLELAASACKWDDQAKLVNIATRLEFLSGDPPAS